MTVWTSSLIAAWLLIASSAYCFGQQPDDFPDSALTPEQWKLRVEAARRRAEEFVANARMEAPPPSEKEEAEAASRRALNDPSLQHGDIIVTGQGFVVFVGREEQHQPNDFMPASDPRYRPQ